MEWILFIIIAVLIIFLVFRLKNKGNNPNRDASLSTKEEEELHEDYLSHGDQHYNNDEKNI